MDPQRSNDVSPEAMQARIQQARREAETLKDRIKRKKDELADTTRESLLIHQVDNHRIIAITIIVYLSCYSCYLRDYISARCIFSP